MLITRPQRRSSIPGSTARASRYGPVALTRRWRSHSAASVFENGADSAMPALLTRTSTGPRLAAIEATPRATAPSSVTSSTSGSVWTPRFGDRGGGRVHLIGRARGDGHVTAFPGQRQRDLTTDAAAGAGDEGDRLRGRARHGLSTHMK